MANILAISPPDSKNQNENNIRVLRKKSGRKQVKKDKAKAYRTVKQKEKIHKMQRTIDLLRKKVERSRDDTPAKVDELTR